jgi:hypothetical protein
MISFRSSDIALSPNEAAQLASCLLRHMNGMGLVAARRRADRLAFLAELKAEARCSLNLCPHINRG